MITTKDAAQRLNVCQQLIRRLLKQGRIVGAVKVGRDWLLPDNFTVTPANRGRAKV